MFEDLGTWEPVLRSRGYDIRYVDVPDCADLDTTSAEDADLLIVLGGPIGVDQEKQYPFLTSELGVLRRRLTAQAPTIGVCLGAQLIATALGGTVTSGSAPEIGFSALELVPGDALFASFRDVEVFSWHADEFALPDGATLLARTEVCACQAFAVGRTVLALQFHAELDANRIDRWLVGHAHELATRGIDPDSLRAQAERYGSRLRVASTAVLERWLDGLDLAAS
jgi:GMP synthase (glutamine-hydrolysing)